MGACCSSNEHCPTPVDAPQVKPATTTTTTTATTSTTTTTLTATTTQAVATTAETGTTTATVTAPTISTAAAATTTRGRAPTPSSLVRRLSRKLSGSKGQRARVKPVDGPEGDPGEDSSDLELEEGEIKTRREEPLIVLFQRANSPQSSYDVEELKVLGNLGSGEYGKVELVQDPRDQQTYALKTINKAHMKKMGKEDIVKNEWLIQSQLDHPFISKLYCALEDEPNIYLLLQPSMGGELFALIRQRRALDLMSTQFYVASVILAFEYMHEKQIIYRDLKPENILLDSQGYIQICDFGCAKKMTHLLLRTFSEVGTPAYSCPEMIAGEGHNNGMDWWDVGVLTYELLTGVTPFVDAKGDDAMAERIKKVDYSFPSNFPKTEHGTHAKDLIKKLLHKNPDKRLGVNREALDQLKAHPMFKGLDWAELSQRRLPAPYVPPLKDKFDLSNFSK